MQTGLPLFWFLRASSVQCRHWSRHMEKASFHCEKCDWRTGNSCKCAVYLKNRRSREHDGRRGKIALVAVVAVKKNWKAPDEARTKIASGRLFLLTLGSKRAFSLHFESFLQSFSWRMGLRQCDEGWRRVILVEEVPSNWQQRWRFCKVSYRIVCAPMADLSVSLAELSRKNAQKPWCWDMLKCTVCVQKRLTTSLEHGDSLACVCEERFLRKGWGKSYFTLKFYCPVPCIPRVYDIHFLWPAGCHLICCWFLAMIPHAWVAKTCRTSADTKRQNVHWRWHWQKRKKRKKVECSFTSSPSQYLVITAAFIYFFYFSLFFTHLIVVVHTCQISPTLITADFDQALHIKTPSY